MEAVYLCYQFSDYDIPVVNGVADSPEAAARLIKKMYKDDQGTYNKNPKKLIENSDGTFKEPDATDGEDHHYWFEKAKMNSATH